MQMKKHNTMSKPAESQGSLAGGRWGGGTEGEEYRQGRRTQPGREGHRQREKVSKKHPHDTDFPLVHP